MFEPLPSPGRLRCLHPGGCETRPSYGAAADGVVRWCQRHKRHSDVNLRVRLCEESGCSKQSSFGLPGEPYRYCGEHKRRCDINTRSARCCSPKSLRPLGLDAIHPPRPRSRSRSGLGGQRKRSSGAREEVGALHDGAKEVVAQNAVLMARYLDTVMACSSQEQAAVARAGEREWAPGTGTVQ